MARVRVLLAEDGAAMALQLGEILQRDFDLLATVGDGQELVRVTHASSPDVIVTDLSMPRMTGLEAARLLLGDFPDLGVVFITVHSEIQMVEHALSLGICSYVLKSDAGDDLVPAVSAAVDRRRYISSSLRDKVMIEAPPGAASDHQ